MMGSDQSARTAVLSELCTNLAAGWFGLIIITPAAIAASSLMELVAALLRALLLGVFFAYVAILLRKEQLV